MRRGWVVVMLVWACRFDHGVGLGDGLDANGDAQIDGVVTATGVCDPLPLGSTVVLVSTVADLRSMLTSAQPGTTIALADGIYDVTSAISIDRPGITVRSNSGDASKVVFRAPTAARVFGINASDVTIASLTIASAQSSGILVQPPTTVEGITGDRIYDVTFDDVPGPTIRILPFATAAAGPWADAGTIACNRFIDTPGVDHCSPSTLAIEAQAVRGWLVRDNYFENVTCQTGPNRNVRFRYGSRDTQLIRNRFVGSSMNIFFGGETVGRAYSDPLPAGCAATPDHIGGVICNNQIAGVGLPVQSGNTDFEEGIALWYACDTWVIHNTIVSPAGAETFHDIEYRFAQSYVHLVNNLLEQRPASRDGGTQDAAFSTSNATYIAESDFVNPAMGDLRLSSTANPPTGASIAGLSMCESDAAGKPRDLAAPMVGAFER